MDNVFVIAMIFAYFGIPRLHQYRVLFWGILGVIVLRAVMIGFGAAAVQQWGWVLYLFAAFLIVTGIKMWLTADKQYDVGGSPVLRLVRRRFRVTDTLHGQNFWVKLPDPASGKAAWFMTPLFLALVMIEFVDVVFAVDSVPAIFAITTDPFIVYTSNIFAILGLRALYFALAAMVERFHYLKYALSVLLVFIGSKILLADALGLAKFPAGGLAGDHFRDPRRRRRLVAMEDARKTGGGLTKKGERQTAPPGFVRISSQVSSFLVDQLVRGDPRHHRAQSAADLLDRVRLGGLAARLEFRLAGAVVEHEILARSGPTGCPASTRFISALVSSVMIRGPVVMSPYSAVLLIE